MVRRTMLLGADLQSKNRHVLPVCLLGLLPELEGVNLSFLLSLPCLMLAVLAPLLQWSFSQNSSLSCPGHSLITATESR